MPSAWLGYHASLPDHCEPVSPFLELISSLFRTCLPTPLALISSTLGMLSIVSWLFAQLPQIYKNYRIKSTAGLSVFFIVEWLLADTANFIGAILTNQAGWQITIAAYYMTVDIIMTYQHYWYTHIKEWKSNRFRYAKSNDDDSDAETWSNFPPSDCDSCQQLPAAKYAYSIRPTDESKTLGKQSSDEKSQPTNSKRYVQSGASGSSLTSPKAILFVSMLCAVLANAASIPTDPSRANPIKVPEPSTKEFVGRIFSWISTILYLGSRLPQLYKNYTRKSTAGLSPLLFIAAFCGNTFYSTSMLTNPNGWSDFPAYGGGGWAGPDGNDRMNWILLAIPFWLGATGVLLLDVCMGIQFMKYGEHGKQLVTRVKSHGRGRRRWTRVTGFMKGWIPSMSPERNAPTGETQSLVSREGDRYGTV